MIKLQNVRRECLNKEAKCQGERAILGWKVNDGDSRYPNQVGNEPNITLSEANIGLVCRWVWFLSICISLFIKYI